MVDHHPGVKNNNTVDDDPNLMDENDDDAKTLITANELINKSGSQVTYQQRSGFEDDSVTLVNLKGGMGDDSFIEGSSSMKTNGSKHFQAHIQQLRYNDSKLTLDRSINTLVETLQDLRLENSVRPIYYPTDLKSGISKLNSLKSRLALIRKSSMADKLLLKRTESFEDEIPQLNILNLNLQIDQRMDNGNEIITNLDKESLASLLDQKIASTIRHLLSLKDRIDDTSSKVFVTGDLNAGKSAFCNALLRRKLLPEDEQPCTNVFSEVIDASENKGIEEVHAVPIGYAYNPRDQTTYSIFPLKELETLVYESDKYGILKIYVNDNRPTEQSLLKNNVIDISLIDAPGLNMDSYQTMEVFSRQEEIDLVVFVVDARNHFTLSGKEFISALANEKNLLFIVVNKFDTVKNKEKCKMRIMDQVLSLSPDTHKDSGEFVHFVSSECQPHGDDGGDPGDDDGDDDDNPYTHDNPDFEQLESSLRKFILEKRSLSKLLPAKNYTLNVLKDLEFLFRINEEVHLRDRESMLEELNDITPVYETTLRQSMKVHDKLNKFIENSCTEAYNFSKEKINTTLNEMDAADFVVGSPLDIYTYAIDLQQAMINKIVDAVNISENYARKITAEKVTVIKQLGVEELGAEFYNNRVFRDDLMFTKKKDSIQKRIDDQISIFDFFDPSIENVAKLCGFHNNSILSLISIIWDPSFLKLGKGGKLQIWKGSASVVATVSSVKCVTNLVPVSNLLSVDFLVKIAKPVLLISGALSVAYLILDMPSSFQRKTARKIKLQMNELDYQHKNSSRISKEVRTVLNYPAREVLNGYQTNIDKTAAKRDKIASNLKNIDLSSAFFSKVHKLAISQRQIVEKLELETLNLVD